MERNKILWSLRMTKENAQTCSKVATEQINQEEKEDTLSQLRL